MNQLKLLVITDMKSRHVICNKLPSTMYYWFSITDNSETTYLKTFDPKQSEKIERNKFLVLKKFVQTTVVSRINVTVDSNTHIFSTSPFEYNTWCTTTSSNHMC